MSNFDIDESFDRVISIEMFEHMRNYKTLLNKISSWLKPEGTLFVHIFVHRLMSYKFEAKDSSDWMSKYFFSGGIMPSDHLLYYFNEDMVVEDHWRVCGTHYQKTARAWLENMDLHKQSIMELFDRHYPKGESTRWLNYWRIFFMSCEELWGYRGGSEWFVAHYLLKQR
jgi:cyclopropane-fatty-acyl-phospholipid synthase